MSKLRYKILLAIIALAISPVFAQQKAGQTINNPMTQAVLNAYGKMLASNPRDYNTYINRAREYYRFNEYTRALSDIDNAIKYTPKNSTQTIFDELMLRASIYEQTDKPTEALADLTRAVELMPNDYVAIYRKANAEFILDQYAAAKSDYNAMLRLNPRSSNAYIGLARVAVKENNLGMANDYLDKAVQFDSTNAETFLSRAIVRKSMGNHNGAVDDIILSLSINPENTRAIATLVDYADTNYPAVNSALSRAIATAPNNGMFRYIRAVIAQAHYHYADALNDFKEIIDRRLYDYYGIYASMATCQYALAMFDDALANIDKAINENNSNKDYYITRSRILLALGRYDEALDAAAKASVINKGTTDAILQMGLCYVSKENYKEASYLFSEATLADSQNPYFFMVRSWVLNDYLKQPALAERYYNHVLGIDIIPEFDYKSLKGFAYLFLGKTQDAISWIDNVLKNNNDNDGIVNYYAACLYAQSGDFDRALSHVEQSLKNGYANYYDWMYNNDARINVAPLRDDIRFLNLLNRYNNIFGR